MGNKKSKVVEKQYVKIQTTEANTAKDKFSSKNKDPTEFLSKETQLRLHFERREAERKQHSEKGLDTQPGWKYQTDNDKREAQLRKYFTKKHSGIKEYTNAIDDVEKQNMKDVEKLLSAIKAHRYSNFCALLQTHPYIQHWKVFEEAVDADINWPWNFLTKGDKDTLTPECELFTLRLMDNGYQISEKELNRIEMRLMLKDRFRQLKRCILDHYLGGVKSLQELCRLSLKKFQLHDETKYRYFVKSLNYPDKLKKYLLE